ncbi:MAG: hypothetical protein HAW63_01425 [Bdellovibrionaceae bacterium]|nr:hypothetical protein [Pseudobdellovibrionaceae bacterium]
MKLPSILSCTSYITLSLKQGVYLKLSLNTWVFENSDAFALELREFLQHWESGASLDALIKKKSSYLKSSFFELLHFGLQGRSVYAPLKALEKELFEEAWRQAHRQLSKLPYIMLVPLLFFQLPAFLLLLFGPLLQNFLNQLS